MSEKNQELCFVIFFVIFVDKTNKITFAGNRKIINLDEHGIVIIPRKSVHQFLENLKEFEAIKLCYDGPSAKMFPDASKNVYSLTSEGLLQLGMCFNY